MDVVRIACIEPPDRDRSRWSRDLLLEAVSADLQPVPLPIDNLTSFTATLPPHLAASLKKRAAEKNWTVPQLAGGLIEAARTLRAAQPAEPHAQQPDDPEVGALRAPLIPLFEGCASAIAAGRVAFAEAATGSGKGRMIALLAARAVRVGQRVVICAPLPVVWQLAETLPLFEGAREPGTVAILLGRANFASPVLLHEWAVEQQHAPLLEWIEAGGPARNARTVELQQRLGVALNWLLEEALDLADDLEPGQVMLSDEDDAADTLAEQTYQALQAASATADITLCSHHMLAASVRDQLMRAGRQTDGDAEEQASSARGPGLADPIDLLLIDEAHQLEQAFASIFSDSFFLKPFERQIEHSTARGRRPVLDAIGALDQAIKVITGAGATFESATGTLDTFPLVALRAKQLLDALDSLSITKREKNVRQSVARAKRTLKGFLSGHGTVRLEVSPVRHYPQMLIGRANLQKPLEHLWARCSAAVLVSATLYTDGVNAGLTRWKLAVPTERASFLPAVIPSWVTDPVTLMLPSSDAPPPDDSPVWMDFQAAQVRSISAAASGGTLVLCTSYLNASGIGERLADLGERLILQTGTTGASVCAGRYRALYQAGLRPVWVGVGAAWTGIDLQDPAVDAAQDRMLTDLVVTRLPLGVNRTLTHERRAAIAGFGVVAQEAVWQLRQGIGRLVRRPGVTSRHLWILDPRLVGRQPWTTAFRQALVRYRQVAPS